MSVFTPKRLERGESWQPLPVHSDQDDMSLPGYSIKSLTPDPDVLSSKSLGDELSSEPDGGGLAYRRHSELGVRPGFTRAVSIDPKRNILNMSPDVIAEQLTLIDLALLKNINLDEFEHCNWTKKEKRTLAPNLVKFLQRFNHTSFWVVRDILNETYAKSRAELITQFIKITRRLMELNNMHSLVATVSALDSTPIQRLSNTWKHVSRRDRSTLEKWSELISNADNYAQFRAHMSPLQLPCIPHLGLYLRDLVYLDSLSSTSGNVGTSQKIGDIMSIIAECRQSRYDKLSAVPVVQKYLLSVRYIEELQKFYEDDNYKLSLQREPDPSLTQATKTPRVVPHHLHPLRVSKSHEELLTPLKPVSAGPKHLVTTPPMARARVHQLPGSAGPNNIPAVKVTSESTSNSTSPRRKGSTLPAKFQPDLKGTQSCSTVPDFSGDLTRKMYTSSPNPSKKKKGHYKSISLGSNVLSVLGVATKSDGRGATPENPSQPMSLLDDSFLDNCVTPSTTESEYYSPYTPPLSTTSSAEVNSDEESEMFLTSDVFEDEDDVSYDEGGIILKEGKLKRKVLKRRGSSVPIHFTSKYWVQLTPSALMYTSPKYKSSKHQIKKRKGILLDGVKIHYREPSFQLRDKQFVIVDKNGTQSKFTASSAAEAESWAHRIRSAGQELAQKAKEKPLIKL